MAIVKQGVRPLVIVGGGLAGGLAAVAIALRRPDVPLLLIEQGDAFGGNHIWSFFDSDVAGEHRWLIEGLAPHRWPDHEVVFPKRRRRLQFGYNSVHSENLDRLVRRTLRPDQLLLGRGILEVAPDHVILEGGERIDALGVIDARGPAPMPGLRLGWQKFVGRTYQFAKAHGVTRPTIMNALVDQRDGYRFIYTLPFSETKLLVEDTYYSNSPELDRGSLIAGLEQIAAGYGKDGKSIAEEDGVLPVVLSGEVDSLWTGAELPRLGLRGGFFHPTTGYSLPDAIRNAALLVEMESFTSAAIHRRLRREAERLWAERRFFKLLNRMLFLAASPGERFRVLEHFYRLPDLLVGRFYAARLTTFDKLRILSGRPPVPVASAVRAMLGTAS